YDYDQLPNFSVTPSFEVKCTSMSTPALLGLTRTNLRKNRFDKWTDTQRRRILTVLLEHCSLSQQKFCCRKLQQKIPAEALDFTTKLPKVLSLYIFSFLDSRSLCHCSQVSWHWKKLTELDQLWMLKCLWFNWYINVSPTPYEQGVWKKHYIQMVKELHVTKPKVNLGKEATKLLTSAT
ncbi:PREDICTED: F-box only protein 16-like, partial [Bison bison bison]|uniref:F-box only protein 16-like n=1 Tax=Bison bison bison TaxID=43346 RepID=A0A6P3HB43_BISBB